jgi:hypothetical protein
MEDFLSYIANINFVAVLNRFLSSLYLIVLSSYFVTSGSSCYSRAHEYYYTRLSTVGTTCCIAEDEARPATPKNQAVQKAADRNRRVVDAGRHRINYKCEHVVNSILQGQLTMMLSR